VPPAQLAGSPPLPYTDASLGWKDHTLGAIDRIKKRVGDIGWLLLLALGALPAALTTRRAKWQTPGGNDGGSMTGFRSLPYLKKILAERDELFRQHGIAIHERDELLRQRDIAIRERDEFLRQRDIALGERVEFLRQRDIALGDRNEFLRQRNMALIERDELLRQRDMALIERDELLRQRNSGA
jgi:hypothetical protein